MTALLIDADGCPVVDLACRAAKSHGLPVVLICDTAHEINRPDAETIIVSKGADAVDFVLVNRVQKGDIVITQDYGLAAMVLARGAYAIDQNGREYTNDNIDQLLLSRHTAKKIRKAGGRLKGPAKRQEKDNESFILQLNSLLGRAMKK
ncbi:YaiI/YqxD family protein [Domibacillus indicus]|uniref:YaiI/YqxD family protein n=1 Tax=Domibacillus indicus TaxID=1437523 RepID=UPI00061818BA|nr:YaiI/YqxD family protein [Domibacillus indicus]